MSTMNNVSTYIINTVFPYTKMIPIFQNWHSKYTTLGLYTGDRTVPTMHSKIYNYLYIIYMYIMYTQRNIYTPT